MPQRVQGDPRAASLVLRVVAELPRALTGCFLSGCWGHFGRCKGQGRLWQLMATLCPLSVRLFRAVWPGDTGTAAIPLVLLGKLRHGLVP